MWVMRRKRWVMGGLVVIGLSASWSGREVAHAAPTGVVRAPAPRAMQADLRIRQIQVAADGTPLGVAAPGVVLHVDRRLQAGHWRLTMTMSGVDRPTVTTPRGTTMLENPFVVSRLEYDEDAGGEPLLYDRAGRRIGVATEEQRRRLGVAASLRRTTWDPDVLAGQVGRAAVPAGGRQMTTGLVAEAGQAPTRRQRLEARYGRVVGRVRGLDRFVLVTGSQTEEALVTTDSALPVEVNVARGGSLASHIRLTYDSNPAVGFVRRLLHGEEVSNEVSGARLVTDVEMANLVVDGGAR
ncbi:MAG: hypothetical protein ABI634_16880 [Acidobacteriota bacterium]